MSSELKRARIRALATTSALALSTALIAAPAVYAQDEAASDVESITVTGSRIVRRDYEANSPIVTIDSEVFESQQGLNVEAYLNKMPQFNPAATPVTTEIDVQVTAVNSTGVANLSLRGLGPNRNVVLVDGHRITPVNALMVTDVNAIPSALVQRVEVITGGASSVYGADAVSGVTNFILKTDYEGLELDTQYGMTEVGDGEEFRISSVLGANLADGRGNVTLGLEHYSRSASYEKNRDWQKAEWADPLSATGDFFVAGVHGYVAGGNGPNPTTVDSIFGAGNSPCALGTLCEGQFSTTFNFNADGTLWGNPSAFGGTGGLDRYNGPLDGYEFAHATVFNAFTQSEVTALEWNNTEAYIGAPQTRYSIFGSGNYDLTDSIQFFARGSFTESKTRTRLFPSPAIGGWEALIPYNATTDSPILGTDLNSVNPNFIASGEFGAQHPVSPELAALLNSRDDPNAAWQLNFIPKGWFDDRSTLNSISQYQLEAGLRGELPIKDWTWEMFVSHGEANTYNLAAGNMSLQRFRQVMLADDYGRNAFIEGNQESVRPGFGIDPLQCTSGFYDTIFGGDQAPTQDCEDAIAANLQTRTQMQQDNVSAMVQGALFELPAGELRGAVGVEYREVSSQFYPDILQSMSSSTDQVIGVYPAAYMDASVASQEAYAELLVPIISGLPGIEELNLELGARFSDYDASDSEWTYKALGDWRVTDFLRVRGGYNRATRAPNLGELFLGKQMIFTVDTQFGDPCSLRSGSPFGAGGADTDGIPSQGEFYANDGTPVDPANPRTDPATRETITFLAPGQTAAGAQSTYLICQAQMALAAEAVGGVGADTIDTFFNQTNAAGGGRALAFNWIYQQGNADLESEVADTWTLGIVANSPFDNPWLSGLTASLDWYRIDIANAIQQYTVDYARSLCYGAEIVDNAADAMARAQSPECINVGRLGGTTVGFGGAADDVLIEYDNQATIETAGIDVAVNWLAQFEDLGIPVPGGIGLNLQATWLDYYRTRASDRAFDTMVEWKGTAGPTLSGTNPGAYEYRIFGGVTYFLDDLSATLRWRHLPEVYAAGYAVEKATFKNNVAVAGGADGIILGFTPGTFIPTDAYDVFDLSGSWQLTDTLAFRAGVNNLFDKDPPRSNASTGYPVGTDFAAVCAAYGGGGAALGQPGPLGCSNPTGPSLPNTGTATAGFYDVYGRSYFLGLKATF